MNVLFVCTGNTCRSPMAEELAEDAAGRSTHLKDMTFRSAGTFACEGEPATPEAIEVMEELDLSLEKHGARQFDKETARWADLILAMEARHIEEMEAMAPEAEHKMHTLLGFAAGVDGYPGENACMISWIRIASRWKNTVWHEIQIADAVKRALKRIEKGRIEIDIYGGLLESLLSEQ
jgi:protein-tyrosine-phosphatase